MRVWSLLRFSALKQKTFKAVFPQACFLLLMVWAVRVFSQDNVEPAAKQLFEQERWQELVAMAQTAPQRSADLDYEYGVALAHLERWDESRAALLAGRDLAPRDKRFLIELAGVAFKQKDQKHAVAYLRRALRLDPKDAYANEFLATLYFIQGNFEAALKYWNRLDQAKPKVEQVRTEPPLRIRPALLDHAFAFAPASTLTLPEWEASAARIQALEIFPASRVDLVPRPEGTFDAVFRAQETNGWGNTRLEGLLRTFRGLPFQEVTPEYFNLNGTATNLTSLVRWDSDKRRLMSVISGPIRLDPRWRFRLATDWRNENWQVIEAFTGPGQLLSALNMRRESFNASVIRLVGARWRWSLGAELSHRDFRNVSAGSALTPQLLSSGYQLKQTAALRYELWRSPESKFTVSAGGVSEAGRLWSQPGESFEKLQGLVEAHWFPRPSGDDFETRWRVRANRTLGDLPFDELFMLGLERDNDLWMHAHVGTRDGRKGNAPLGRNYFLSNWETDKNVYSNGFLTIKLGPFLDIGKITDPASSLLGARKWLWDTGAQAKLRVLGVGVVFSYGKDLRTGNNAFYATVAP